MRDIILQVEEKLRDEKEREREKLRKKENKRLIHRQRRAKK